MPDPTEAIRKVLADKINDNARDREALEKEYSQVWDTDEVQKEFEVQGFAAPVVMVIRKSDRKKGAMTFQHHPRFYFDFQSIGE